MIDFFAMQFEKMAEAFGSVGALYEHQSYPRVGIDKVSVAMEEAFKEALKEALKEAECGVGGLHV